MQFNLFIFLVMTTSTPEKQDGLRILQEAIDKINTTITELGGVFNVQMAPKVVTATDEADLMKQMEKAEAENAEVAGDDDGDDDEEVKAFSDDDDEANGSADE